MQPHFDSVVPISSLWHKDVPLKVVLFVWCMFRDRLSIKDNLLRRHVIDTDAQLCVGGCGAMETSCHLLFHCNFFGSIWHYIFRWLGIATVSPFDAANHFTQFSFVCGVARTWVSMLQVIWFASVWEIWKERNNRLFNGKDCSIMQVVEKIKSHTFMWLKNKFHNLVA